MNCEEFAEMLNSVDLLELTQAERSVMYNHFINCKPCRAMIMAMPYAYDKDAENLAEEDFKAFNLFSEN